MYQFIKVLDERINSRYLTVMRNVRASSNSFYDSYLDLLEETVREKRLLCAFSRGEFPPVRAARI